MAELAVVEVLDEMDEDEEPQPVITTAAAGTPASSHRRDTGRFRGEFQVMTDS